MSREPSRRVCGRLRAALFAGMGILCLPAAFAEEKLYRERLNVEPPPIASDPTVRYDYDIVYVRAQRAGDEVHRRFYTDIAAPLFLEAGADLMLLHPDGSEELLVAGGKGSVTDPVVSLDGQWVFYALIHDLEGAGQWQPPRRGSDIFRIHVASRRIEQLTTQAFTPNTGAASWSKDARREESDRTYLSYGVMNLGPCPLPGGRLAFTSNRNAFRPPRAYPTVALQLFVMDENGGNLSQIGHLNLAGALHPVVLTDGRIIFSSLESQGARSDILWGIWSIHPDGTSWNPVVSAFDPGGAPNAFHFQTQLSDGSIVVEEYYNQNNSGFGAYWKLPLSPREGYPAFGPAYMDDSRHAPIRFGRFENGRPRWYRMPFLPAGAESLTPFAKNDEGPADPSVLGDEKSPRVGKFTHPSGAPDNHLLTVWSPGPVNHQYTFLPQLDGGIYLLKGGKPIDEPGQLLKIKNDPRYNESWPRAVVPYARIYGVPEPRRLPELANDGSLSPRLPAGSPYGLVGTSSLYKRESYPNGAVPPGRVTSAYAGGKDPWKGLDAFTSHGNGMPINWHNQGADAGLYSNDDIHAIRILALEPTTDRNRGPRSGRLFHSHAMERMRILGEIPVRKFLGTGSEQPRDPDGNPDTSFLARLPADTAFTFQTIDAHGMVLNMAQTWHQLRPGEVRTNCGGCHAHSQRPTAFEATAAAKPDYEVWDLTHGAPIVTTRANDTSGKRWDERGDSGLRFEAGAKNVEYLRDVQPILRRSCAACHTKRREKPAGNLVLDADDETVDLPNVGRFPGTYYRLALDEAAKFGHKPVGWDSWGYPQASRYVRKLQSRRSLLVWKIFGRRLDGFSNDDHPSESKPGSGILEHHGARVDMEKHRAFADVDFIGSPMPPPASLPGGDAASEVRVEPLTDEDRFTIVRWIDLGCPIDLDYDPSRPDERGFGWMCDDNRPVLTLHAPWRGRNDSLPAIVLGMCDYSTGIDLSSFRVTASFPVDGRPAGENLAGLFRPHGDGIWRAALSSPVMSIDDARLLLEVKDHQGNWTRLDRTFSVGALSASPSTTSTQSLSVARLPHRVHVFEDYETTIEKRWWLRGKPAEDEPPPSSSRSVANARTIQAAASKDFDDLQGDPKADWNAVVFNPVPGPPMGPRTRLKFRYRLAGTSSLRVQIYSLSNNYHRRLLLDGLPTERWSEADVDMTLARRPDGSGGPLAEGERIDDIQFYVPPGADLRIDDVVLYEAAAGAEAEVFPRRIIFTGWFDTGRPGEEWPGDFEVVRRDASSAGKAVRSIPQPSRGAWLRVGLRGERKLSAWTRLRFRYLVRGADRVQVALRNQRTNVAFTRSLAPAALGEWSEARLDFVEGPLSAGVVDEVCFELPAGGELTVDDLLLYEPELEARAF